ncbi:MAG: hypothetical protein M3O36_19080 [Myxococcota bacterium]|nr:hypothetical protein [Myxococcota bacterium]
MEPYQDEGLPKVSDRLGAGLPERRAVCDPEHLRGKAGSTWTAATMVSRGAASSFARAIKRWAVAGKGQMSTTRSSNSLALGK